MEYHILIGVAAFVLFAAAGYLFGRAIAKASFERRKREWEKDLREKAIKQSRSVIEGKVSEQLAPFLPNFVYSPGDARFLGSPVDFIVFDGLSAGSPREIVFVEVKKGSSALNGREKAVRDLVEERKVRWEVYRIP
jgi:predicted Holliday junction resolvase-like endonuclease